MNKRKLQLGFTLVEILVVIGIIGVLVALLLPAIQASRTYSRRQQCGNNLHQIAVATQDYHDSNKRFPSGYESKFDQSGADLGPGWGWGAKILPQLEETAIYQTLHFDKPIEDAMNDARVAVIPSYLCPGDNAESQFAWTAKKRDQSGQPLGTICGVAPSNYVGMFGTTEPGVDGDGCFFRNSKIGTKNIIDGTSKTILLGERSVSLGHATWTGAVTDAILFTDDGDNIGRPRVEHSSGMILGHAGERRSPGDPQSDVNQFYSLHGSGANFAFADGHVQFLTADLNYQTYRALATRAGNETIGEGNY